MDVFDQAQEHDELFRQAALRAHFAGRQYSEQADLDHLPVPRGHKPRNQGLGAKAPVAPDSNHMGRLCLDCGDEIEPERLKALPYVVRCIDCQTKKERRERLRG